MKRRNSLKISDEQLDFYLKLLEESFSIKWLHENSGHPLQALWKRNDELATSELFTLAYAIHTLKKIDPLWTKKQLEMVKSNDKNNYQGAIFEFIGLNMINNPLEHPVKPAKFNQAGYDGILTRSDNTEVRVSIKNYGSSTFERSFERKAKSIEAKMLGLLKKYKYPPVQILLDFPDKYPDERDWKMLEERLDEIFKSQRTAKEPFTALVEPVDLKKELSRENTRKIFIIIISPFKFSKEQFHEKFHSYTLMILANYHHNEHQNLFSKMNGACANLLKHSATEDERTVNSLLLHLPATVSLDKCVKWLDDYFEEFPEKEISFVFLYQPAVSEILTSGQTFIQHCFKIYIKKGKKIKGSYEFCVPDGIVSDQSTSMFCIAEMPDGKKEKISLEERYIYQHGEHYMKLKPDGNGGYNGNISRLGNGVFANIVLELPGQKNTAVIHGKFAPSDDLLML